MILPDTKGSYLFSGVSLGVVLFLLFPIVSSGGELRDYRLYTDKNPAMSSGSPNLSAPGSALILDQFRTDIKDLSNDQRQVLRNNLSAKWKEAEKRGQRDQMNYFSNLIAILEATK